MLLKRTSNPRTIFRFATITLLVFFALPLVARPTATFWVDLLDGVRGAMLGITIGLLAIAGILKRRGGSDSGAASVVGK
jgi:hypothetical protein